MPERKIGPFTPMQAAIWSALEERLEDHIHLDLNDPEESAAFSAMVEQVEASILAEQKPVAATWITIQRAADLMSVSTKTVRRLIARGDLPARKIGERMVRIDAADLDAVGTARR